MTDKEFFTWIQAKGLNLTQQQTRAVVHNEGVLLILTVPGAGKTTGECAPIKSGQKAINLVLHVLSS